MFKLQQYQARVQVIAKGGKVLPESDRVSVSNAREALLLITAATSYRKFDDVSGDAEGLAKRVLAAAVRKSFPQLRESQRKDHQSLFRRVSLELGRTDSMKLPTDVRIQRFAGGNDPQLVALYYQFGRYLLISCSRPGGQPANLQGLWNASLNPPWQSKYTININTEMNYWPAESGNLAECVEPLIAMVNDLTVTGGRTARSMYGARGWVVHHNTDLWRATAPIDGPDWGMWPCVGAWLCLHLWDRYKDESDAYDQLGARSLELGRQAVEGESAGAGLFVGGAASLLRNRAFADLKRMRALLRTLEERRLLVELLSRVLEEEGVQVVIGRENPVADLADCSIVTSNYRAGDRLMGTVGIVGPTRMEYARAIALVDHLARVLTRLLSGTGN